jgi:hypothetical protein
VTEIDPDLGANWRAASSEQPPPALDDAIRAAARREVGTGPARLRPVPRWWPLAAAATVAVVAVGIVQMTPPEQVTPAAFPQATDAARENASHAPSKPQESALKRDSAPEAKEQRAGSAVEKNAGVTSADRGFAAAPGAMLQEKKSRLDAPAERAAESLERQQASKRKTELAAASPAARPSSDAASPAAPSTSRSELQPFPAAPRPSESDAKLAAPPMIAPAPASAPPPPASPSPMPMPAPAMAAPTAPAPTASGGVAAGIALPPPPPPIAGEARALAAQSSATSGLTENASGNLGGRAPGASSAEATARNSAVLGKVASADADKVAPERRKDATPLAPDEWIKRIRRLIAEGKNEGAAKELADFRREYKERADVLLPVDLRNFKP